MKKYLGIDFGDSYIGLAIADGSGIAVPLSVLRLEGHEFSELRKIIEEESISDIVVGWPMSMSGAENERTRITGEFIKFLAQHTPVPIHRADERLTSAAAKRKTSKARVDAVAAAEILQTYLDGNESRRSL